MNGRKEMKSRKELIELLDVQSTLSLTNAKILIAETQGLFSDYMEEIDELRASIEKASDITRELVGIFQIKVKRESETTIKDQP